MQVILSFRARLSGATTKKIRADHENLTRENEKLVRRLDQAIREQQAQPAVNPHVVVVEEEEDRSDSQVNDPLLDLRSYHCFFCRRNHR